MGNGAGQDRGPQWPKVAVGFGLMPTSGAPTGDQIRRAREAQRMTQADLAAALGVGKRTIGRWERGESVPRSSAGALMTVLAIPTVDDRPEPTDQYLDDDTIAAALRQASHLQVLAELARRIQAAQETGRDLPVIPQVNLEWPMQGATEQDSLVSDANSPDRPPS